MTISDIADEIYSEAGEPSDTSIAAIAYWTRNKLGWLNSRIFATYTLSNTYEIIDTDGNTITPEAASIIKKFWSVERYGTLIRNMLTSLGSSSALEITDDNSTVRKSDKNTTLRVLKELKKDELEELEFLIASYKIRASTPDGVTGDDDIEGVRGYDGNVSNGLGYYRTRGY